MDTNSELPPFDPELVTRVLAGRAPLDERRAIERWAAECEAHARQWARLQVVWNTAQGASRSDERKTDSLVEAVLGEIAQTRSRRNDPKWGRSVKGISFLQTRRKFRVARVSVWAASVAIVIMAGQLVWQQMRWSTPNEIKAFSTKVGEQATVTLTDGTRVSLAPNTTLQLTDFGARSRTVTLQGEAYFEIVHATGVPFMVRSGAATTQVLGTAFLIRTVEKTHQTRISVTEGKVRVTAPSLETELTVTAGHVGEVTDSTARVSGIDDLAPGTEWVKNRLVFHNTPVEAVLATLTRWYGYQFRCADSALTRRNVTIGVNVRSSSAALATLEQILGVNVTVVGDTVTLTPQPVRPVKGTPRVRGYDIWTPKSEVGR